MKALSAPGSGAPLTARRVWDGLRWWGRGVLGGSKYEGYLAWHSRHGTGEPMSEKDYWRHRSQHEEDNPSGRCC